MDVRGKYCDKRGGGQGSNQMKRKWGKVKSFSTTTKKPCYFRLISGTYFFS